MTCCSIELGQEGAEQAGPTIGRVSITSLLLAMAGLLLLPRVRHTLQFQYNPLTAPSQERQHHREVFVCV